MKRLMQYRVPLRRQAYRSDLYDAAAPETLRTQADCPLITQKDD